MSKVVDKTKCIACGACGGVCPVEAISYGNDGIAVIDKGLCIDCGACVDLCPVGAITD